MIVKQDAMLLQGGPRDAAADYGTYRSLQQQCAIFTAIATHSN